jgi:hypothetical protein
MVVKRRAAFMIFGEPRLRFIYDSLPPRTAADGLTSLRPLRLVFVPQRDRVGFALLAVAM